MFVNAFLSVIGGLSFGGLIGGIWMRWSLERKYKEMEKMRAVLFQQLMYEYDKKIEIEELLEEVDDWMEEYDPKKVFSKKTT
jgi:Na+/glutamate symporter|tara:strand:+ start:2578 stop:2823 length:246 start_codon:yes stop_codon:yes gene_type:complete